VRGLTPSPVRSRAQLPGAAGISSSVLAALGAKQAASPAGWKVLLAGAGLPGWRSPSLAAVKYLGRALALGARSSRVSWFPRASPGSSGHKLPACSLRCPCLGARCVAAKGFSSGCPASGSPGPGSRGALPARDAPAALACLPAPGSALRPLSPPGEAGGVRPCRGAPRREGQRRRRKRKRKAAVSV